MSCRQQQELEQEREQEALEVLCRLLKLGATRDDLDYLAHELGVFRQFQKEWT